MIPLSILDLAPIRLGSDAAAAFHTMRAQARHAEKLGFRRYWIAEHHNMAGIGSAATSVLIAHVAEATEKIRVGSGGIMLPNHAPLVIAEQFGTLESLYPGRIDLGLGRAPGTDLVTVRALRRERIGSDRQFPRDVLELQAYFRDPEPDQAVRAVPGAGLQVPIWLLGSSLFSAQLAAHLGLPYAFASHFAPALLADALHVYRTTFRPSEQLAQPYAMVGVNVAAADSDEEARRLFTSQQVQSIGMMRGRRDQLGPSRRRHRDLLDRPGETGGRGEAELLRRRGPGCGGGRDQRPCPADGRRRAHRHLPHLRPGGMPPLARDPGRGAGRTRFNRQLRRKP